MKKLFLFLLLHTSLFSQDWYDYITSIEVSYNTTLVFQAPNGFELKANYDYFEGKNFSALWGLGLMYYTVNGDTLYDNAVQDLDMSFTSTHLNFYAGSSFYVTENFSLLGDLYLGMFSLNVKSAYVNSTYSIDSNENLTKLFLDYGTQFGFAYNISDDWIIHLKVFKSLRTVFEKHSFLYWLVGSENAPTRVNLGIKYYFN